MAGLERVYFFPQKPDGEETGDAIPIELTPEQTADLSKLPEDSRRFLSTCGLPDEMHQGFVRPEEGERYLRALLRSTNPLMRFRSSPGSR
jgi:hypothetical protein